MSDDDKSGIVDRLIARMKAAGTCASLGVPKPMPRTAVADDCVLPLYFAREYGVSDSILYYFLQKEQKKGERYGDGYNVRRGRRWVPCRSAVDIYRNDLPCFRDPQTILDAAERLEAKGFILTDSTGDFVERDQRTGRKRDYATWWHVHDLGVQPDLLVTFNSSEARKHGMAQALILAYCRKQKAVETEEDGQEYKKLSPTEIERVLPMDERTIREKLKMLVAAGILVRHPKKVKLYTCLPERSQEFADDEG